MSVTVLVNRRARHLRDPGPILAALHEPRSGVEVIDTHTLEGLDEAARRIERRSPRAVVLAGGDGSYMAGVTALWRVLGEARLSTLPIALAPGGTASTVPRDWGWRGGGLFAFGSGGMVARVRAVLDAASADGPRTRLRPTLRVTDDVTTRIGFIVGAGLVARFFELYEAHGADGERTAARLVLRIFGSSFVGGRAARAVLTPVRCAVAVDDVPAPFDEISLLCASVIRDLGLGMRLLPRAGERSDRFHVVATPAPPRRLGPQMPRVLAGRPLRDPKLDRLARTVSLSFPNGAGAYVIDGELLRSDELVIDAGPLLRVIDLPDG
jgi:diacylglycerol kinase family enzyme